MTFVEPMTLMLNMRLLRVMLRATLMLAPMIAATFAIVSPSVAVVCGETLTASVVFDADLSCPASDGLLIGADDVTIDLDGHAIVGTDASNGIVNSSGFNRVTVKNGTVQGFSTQIYMVGGEGDAIKSARIAGGDQGMFLGGVRLVRILKVVTARSDGTSIHIIGDDNLVAQSFIIDNVGSGISGNVVTGNTISANQSGCISINAFGGTGNVATKNLCDGNELDGIRLINAHDGIVAGNTVIGSTANGIRVGGGSSGNQILKNKVTANQESGIYLPADSNDTTILGNMIHRNAVQRHR